MGPPVIHPPPRRRRPERCAALLLVLALQSCSVSQQQANDLADGLQNAGPEQVLGALGKLKAQQRDRSQHLMQSGLLKLLSGDFEGCILDLETAKQLLAGVQAISISETLGAVTINETLRVYAGTPGERVLLHEVLALAFVLQGQLEDARVEILQADALMRTLARGDALDGQVASTRYLGGLVFELLGEWSDAMISYRKAAEILQQRGQHIPVALQDSLLEISARMGLDAEHADYRAAFGDRGAPLAYSRGEVIALYWDGIVSRLRQSLLAVYVPELQQTVSLALPYYPARQANARHLTIRCATAQAGTQVLEDVDALARQDLKAREAAIYAAALARVVAKSQAVRAAQRDNPYVGILTNMATLFTEVADTRSWNVLPSSIQVARVTLAPDEDAVTVVGAGLPGAMTVPVVPGSKNVLLISSVSQRTFSHVF